ncbi:hypothetical protein V9T40_006117 [Parthenolecanium corni]|uniref:Uncharacterized protein n=1 Tax=Parthenolecanium corni TaxID=536013 RepID=A0AAN9TVB1_9HEMI
MSEPHPQKCAAAYARSVRHKNSTNNYINQADKSEALQALPFTDKVALQQSKDEAMKGARRSAEFVHESAHSARQPPAFVVHSYDVHRVADVL